MKRKEAKAFIPLIAAWAEGKTIQFKFGSEWQDLMMTGNADEGLNWCDPVSDYRIKPEPKLRPWSFDEVPPLALIRDKGFTDGWTTIVGARRSGDLAGIWLHGLPGDGPAQMGFEHAFHQCEHSTDGGIHWLPCGVKE